MLILISALIMIEPFKWRGSKLGTSLRSCLVTKTRVSKVTRGHWVARGHYFAQTLEKYEFVLGFLLEWKHWNAENFFGSMII